MPKRFLDTGFLNQTWIRKLSPERKSFLIYLMLKCDNAGIIDLDIEDAEFWIGKKVGDFMSFLPENYLIQLEGNGKYFMPKFIEWQYGDLSSNKNIVAQARKILEKQGLINSDFDLILPKSYITTTQTLPESQVTSNSNSIGKGNSKGNSKEPKKDFAENVKLSIDEYDKLVEKHGVHWTKKIIEKLDNYKGASGKTYKSDYKAILSWVIDEIKKSPDYNTYMTNKLREEKRIQDRKHDEALRQLKERIPETNNINKYGQEQDLL